MQTIARRPPRPAGGVIDDLNRSIAGNGTAQRCPGRIRDSRVQHANLLELMSFQQNHLLMKKNINAVPRPKQSLINASQPDLTANWKMSPTAMNLAIADV
jgi:hypothetical protein